MDVHGFADRTVGLENEHPSVNTPAVVKANR